MRNGSSAPSGAMFAAGRFMPWLALIFAAAGCATPLAGDLLAQGKPVFGVELRPEMPPDEAVFRQQGLVVERPEPGVMRVKGPSGGDRKDNAALDLFFVEEGTAQLAVAAALPADVATRYFELHGAKTGLFRRSRPEGPPIGWMERFGMLYYDDAPGAAPGSYLALRWVDDELQHRWMLRIWNLQRFAARFGPLEARTAIEKRWESLPRAGMENWPEADRVRLMSATSYAKGVGELRRELESALQRAREREREAEREAARRDEEARRYASLKAGASERAQRLNGLYQELAAQPAASRSGFEPGHWYGRSKEIAAAIGEILLDDSVMADGDGLPLTAVSLRAFAGQCLALGGDPRADEVFELAVARFAALPNPWLDHITTEAQLDDVSPMPLRSNTGEYLQARAWNANRAAVKKGLSDAIVLTTTPVEIEMTRTVSSRVGEEEYTYEEEVTDIPEENKALIAALMAKLEENGRWAEAQRQRLGAQSGDTAGKGIIQDQTYDPNRPSSGVAQGGGLSGSAAWRIMDAEQELKNLAGEHDQLSGQIERLSVPVKRTVTRKGYRRKTLFAWDVSASNSVRATDPRGGEGAGKQVANGRYDADTEHAHALTVAEPKMKKVLATVGARPAWTAMTPMLRARLAPRVAEIKDRREAALFRFYYLFEGEADDWEGIVMGR